MVVINWDDCVFMLGIFAVLGVFFISFVSAAEDNTQTSFNLNGCNFEFGGETIGVAAGHCSDGAAYGRFFCGENLEDGGWDTSEANLGCSRGEASYTTGLPAGPCCPAGYDCLTDGNFYSCQLSVTECSESMGPSECEGVDGWYYDDRCVCNRADMTCDDYVSKADCESDPVNVDKGIGLGSEYRECENVQYAISNPTCYWNNDAGLCQTGATIGEDIEGINVAGIKFNCFNSYSLGECIDGVQNVSWTSDYTIISGASEPLSEDLLDCVDCNGGETSRFCGEPKIKLPGFSFFSLVASLFVIGIYYFILGKFKSSEVYSLE